MSRVGSPDLDAESQAELAALKRALRIADGFTLYVARANTATLRRQIIADLRASLSRPLVVLTLSRGEPPYEQIARVAESAPAYAVLSVEGLDALAPSDDPDWLMRQLNWRRAVYRRLGRPLLLWVPEYLLLLMMRHAPDFFDWHSGFFEFTAPQKIREAVMVEAQAVDDVEQSSMTVDEKRERIAMLRGLLDEYVGEKTKIRRARAELLHRLGVLHRHLGEYAEGYSYEQQSLAAARQIGDRLLQVKALNGMAQRLGSQDLIRDSLKQRHQALSIIRSVKVEDQSVEERRMESTLLGNIGRTYRILGDLQRAIEYYQEALQVAREIGYRHRECSWLCSLGIVHYQMGNFEYAMDYEDKALKIAREIGDSNGEATCLGVLGQVYAERGDLERAIDYYEQALQIVHETGYRRGESIWLNNLGKVYAVLGDIQKARDFYDQSLQIMNETPLPHGKSFVLGSLGDLYASQGDVECAVDHYQQAIEAADGVGNSNQMSHWQWNLGLLHEQQGDPTRAAELMSVRVAYEREIGHPDAEPHAARVQEMRARLSQSPIPNL